MKRTTKLMTGAATAALTLTTRPARLCRGKVGTADGHSASNFHSRTALNSPLR